MLGRKLLFLSLLLFTGVTILAQHRELSGFVIDETNNEPVEGANVFIHSAEIGTTSDADGYFKLLIDPKYETDTLVISYLGYKDFRLAIDRITGRLTIKLRPQILELDRSISVTAELMDLAQREVAHSVYHIDMAEIERIGSGEISDILKSVPAVRIEGNDLDGRTIQIRGSNPDEVNVYIDGILINNLRFDNVADLTLVPTESIEKLDILKGGNLLLLGNGAFGGVVNITTKKRFENSYGIKVKGGSFDTRFILGEVNFALTDQLNMNYFGQFNSSAPEIEFYQGELYADKSRNNAIKTKKQNHHFNINYLTSIGQYNAKFMGYFFDYDKPGLGNKYNNLIFAGSYRGSIWGTKDFDLSANYLSGENEFRREQANDQVHVSGYKTDQLNVRLAKAFLFATTDLQLLTDYYHDRLHNSSEVVTPDISRNVYISDVYDNRIAFAGVFSFRDSVKAKYDYSWKTFLGLRYDILANGRKDLTNSFGLQLSIQRRQWFIQPYAHYGKNVKYPTLLENAFIRDINDIFRSDSTQTTLEPEYNNTGELGLNVKYESSARWFRSIDLGFAYFNNIFYNKLLTRPFDNLISIAQQGRNETRGIELSFALNQIWHYLYFSASYLALNISDPFLYPYKPDKNYSVQLDFRARTGFYFHSSFFYEGTSTTWYYNSENVLITEFIEPFFDMDLSAGYRFNIDRLQLNLQMSGYNILDNSGYKYYTLKKQFLQVSLAVKY
jgi:outer membrane cobalamin receptor